MTNITGQMGLGWLGSLVQVLPMVPLELHDLAGDASLVIIASGNTHAIHTVHTINDAACRLFGCAAADVIGQPLTLLLPDWSEKSLTIRGACLNGCRHGGEVFPVAVALGLMAKTEPGRYVLIVHDITDSNAMAERNQRLLTIIEECNDEIFIVDPGSWRFRMVNRRARENLGHQSGDFSGLSLLDINLGLSAARLDDVYCSLRERTMSEWSFQSSHIRKNGSTYEVDFRMHLIGAGLEPHVVIITRDTSATTLAESIHQRQAFYDPITTLPNRRLFLDRLQRALSNHVEDSASEGGAVLMVSIDNIDFVSDGLGPAAADQLMREMALRLSGAVRARDTVARLGEIEFAVLSIHFEHDQDAGSLAERILVELRRPIMLGSYQVVVPAVIGIASFPHDGNDTETLLRNAAAALQGAREDAVINYRFFTSSLNLLVKNRMAINSGLSRALEHREFSLVYQPKVDIASWEVLGVEALLRWRNLDLGTVSPDIFVPVLERTGLISEVGSWVLETACRQRRLLKDAGFPNVRMAINLSVRQLRHEFLGTLVAVLANSGLTASDIELEITESVIVKDGQAAVGLLREIAAMGIHLSMDDFGCGYSSLSHLRRLPLETIKIDRSFIEEVASVSADAEIVKAIISMGHALRLRVVAEGVETVQQLAALRHMGCDEIQGYLFSPPVSADELLSLLANANTAGNFVVM
ncbi:MAG: EAL domain-containing protein [Rhodospirillaceae bacterium]